MTLAASKRGTLTLVLLSLLLVGCTPRLGVELASDQESLEAPSFEVSERKRKAPRYDTITVIDSERNREEVWQVRADPFMLKEQPSRVTYGQTPEGFEVLTDPQPLVPGRVYSLVVEGKGVGFLSFLGNDSGLVTVHRK